MPWCPAPEEGHAILDGWPMPISRRSVSISPRCPESDEGALPPTHVTGILRWGSSSSGWCSCSSRAMWDDSFITKPTNSPAPPPPPSSYHCAQCSPQAAMTSSSSSCLPLFRCLLLHALPPPPPPRMASSSFAISGAMVERRAWNFSSHYLPPVPEASQPLCWRGPSPARSAPPTGYRGRHELFPWRIAPRL